MFNYKVCLSAPWRCSGKTRWAPQSQASAGGQGKCSWGMAQLFLCSTAGQGSSVTESFLVQSSRPLWTCLCDCSPNTELRVRASSSAGPAVSTNYFRVTILIHTASPPSAWVCHHGPGALYQPVQRVWLFRFDSWGGRGPWCHSLTARVSLFPPTSTSQLTQHKTCQ